MNSSSANSPNEQQIIEAVNLQRDEAIALLCQLVSQPSLLGNEKLAQDVMSRRFATILAIPPLLFLMKADTILSEFISL